ncbi:MAG TPA: glycosyltransferase [Candidatus Acidoferrales bacterium]|nr:glycosyltransferase [Candidatus Acidoferrales bacterium]
MHVCVVKYRELTETETFIRAHVERLPARVSLLEGRVPRVEGRPVLRKDLKTRLYRKAARFFGNGAAESEATLAYLEAFKRLQPDVVLAEYGVSGVLVMDACRRARIPLVAHFYGFDASNEDVLKEHADTYPVLLREAAAMVVVSRAMEKQILSWGAPPAKVIYNPCGVDTSFFAGAEPRKAPPVFLFTGRFVEKKAPQLTLLAFAQVHQRHPEARLRMIGDGPLAGACRDIARALRISEAVAFLGFQPPAIVREEMRNARAYVQHSVVAPNGDSEGTPLAILEAGAAGLPVVATRHAGIPDAVADGETGFLIEERDVFAMADRMGRLARDPDLAGAMGAAARRRIEEEFSATKTLKNLWGVIERVAGSYPRR